MTLLLQPMSVYVVKRSSNVHETNDSLIYRPVGRLNKKDGLTRYGDSHDKDKTS